MDTQPPLSEPIIPRGKKKLYRFQPISKCCGINYLSSLSKDQIWASDPETFNDPFDLNMMIVNDTYKSPFSNEVLKNAAKVLYENDPNLPELYDQELLHSIRSWAMNLGDISLLEAIRNRIKKYGLVCLTPILENNLMWSHYANNHQGFAVEYTIPEHGYLLTGNEFSYSNVQYSTELPRICISEIVFSPLQAMEKLLTFKAIDWSYEQEFRLIHSNKKNQLIALPNDIQISKLIAGEKISNENLQLLQEKANELNISWSTLRRVSNQYSYEETTECQTIWKSSSLN